MTIDGVLNVNHFEGQGGTVSLDLGLGEDAKQARSQETTIAALGDKGDGLKIGTATGSAKLEVINTNAALNKGEVEKLYIVSIDDAQDFDGFSLAKPVTAGAYDYKLVTQDRQATGSGVETGQDIYSPALLVMKTSARQRLLRVLTSASLTRLNSLTSHCTTASVTAIGSTL